LRLEDDDGLMWRCDIEGKRLEKRVDAMCNAAAGANSVRVTGARVCILVLQAGSVSITEQCHRSKCFIAVKKTS
jgi:hypothetical protein